MILIDQSVKKIMERCKQKARESGLKFDAETLEYIVTNRDMLELSPKVMIPTLYDYWVHDVEVLKSYGKYKLFPSNPYETVINSRPAISFYNDNNPDWLNTMIFYHVLGHIDFFQNNILFEKTWNDDFVGQALADKRLIANLRLEHNRWVDYVIEFSRAIDNITGYFANLVGGAKYPSIGSPGNRADYYFNVFLPEVAKAKSAKIFNEVLRYNELQRESAEVGERIFFSDVKTRHPEFEAKFEKHSSEKEETTVDILEYIRENSPFLRAEKNRWMKSVMTIIRNTSLYFAPQIRSKIINEGWASYWHDKLFREDERVSGKEIAYAKINAYVTSVSRVGLNPYAIGLRLIEYVEELANKGKLHYEFQKNENAEFRRNYDMKTGDGKNAIFALRSEFSDFMLINTFVDQEFVDKHDLFVVGKRFDQQRQTIQYYVKSRKAEDYKKMLLDSLYHPPVIRVDEEKTDDKNLYLVHEFENKQLIRQFIPDVMIGIEYLWGGRVQLETTEIVKRRPQKSGGKSELDYRRVLYTVQDKKFAAKAI